VHAKPIIVVNVSGYFDGLDALLHATVKKGFAKQKVLKLYYLADGAEAALEILEGALNAPARS
jgi:predicted Rossmann-fold nucleotide-binding protein